MNRKEFTMKDRTHKALADEIIEGLAAKIDLIFISRGDKLSDEQVAAVVAGDTEKLYDLLSEWESESLHLSAAQDIKDAAESITRAWAREDDDDPTLSNDSEVDYTDLLDSFEYTEDWERVRQEMFDRESGDWLRDLMNGCDQVLLRIPIEAIDEDHSYQHEEVDEDEILTRLQVPLTELNRKVIGETLANASPEFSVLMGYWIVGASVRDIWDLPNDEDTEVAITDPYVYLGNPFAGSGWISEDPLRGTVRVKRADLRTDSDAFGYPVSEVYGGLYGSQFSAEITVVPKEESDA